MAIGIDNGYSLYYAQVSNESGSNTDKKAPINEYFKNDRVQKGSEF